MNDPYDLQCSIDAQNPVFEQVCAELSAGQDSLRERIRYAGGREAQLQLRILQSEGVRPTTSATESEPE